MIKYKYKVINKNNINSTFIISLDLNKRVYISKPNSPATVLAIINFLILKGL